MRSCAAIALLLAGCVTETVGVSVQLDTTTCTAQVEITRVDLFLLRIREAGLCTVTQGSQSGPSGTLVLEPGPFDDSEVVLLALAYGNTAGACDGPGCDQDGPALDGAVPDQTAPVCGDLHCDTAAGESCQSCPQDCGNCGPNTGQPCVTGQPCPTGETCIVVDTKTVSPVGICASKCNQPGDTCPTGDPSQSSLCLFSDKGYNYCVYVCEISGTKYPCPPGSNYACANPDSPMPPASKICVPTCGNGSCDAVSNETCQSCPQDCCAGADAGRATYGLSPCVRCHGLARIRLGEQSEGHTVKLAPTPTCTVPPATLAALGLPASAVPPPACAE